MTKVAVIVGSLQTNSMNKKLAKSLEMIAGDRLEFAYVDINLPLFNQDLEDNVPASVEAARTIVREADGVLLVTPEYNRSITGVLKNAIDWLSRPSADGAIQRKKVALAGASGGQLATGPAQSHLRSIIGYLNMPLMGQPELYLRVMPDTFRGDGALSDTTYAGKYIDALVEFLR